MALSTALGCLLLLPPLRLPHVAPPRRCPPAVALDDADNLELEMLLDAIESLRNKVSSDAAAAAMQAVRDQRSIDSFISDLQAEVAEAGEAIERDYQLLALNIEEQSAAFGREKRNAMADRAATLLSELEAAAPASFRNRNALVAAWKHIPPPSGAF
ncbi:hypothetical protein EMIHUDRAFT_123015 [Emiliania huxleyi CCMP1516]|uniref:Uncharacterized protein n=2 Tax=Emiliania huxleyi TaxID=2903 RepID=A0A0D3K812_EMIH1|nr:hypothetical protein EMIHUDRAFT_257088 [Emiliania huxleyi CCMP1516]XP_005784326.1 hypothetical protein EMIHUDRAFT_123015 [Emiliania huxleyi CCMP1516]EOD12709.1 hypothetical protein EMIHUDRAFT_257088 [Emiliania huxleyi CCMP1516]EOD31897.1 hypothetical protein EMIHUDRAFT_123015 [Emiliania huxleyi CCMP1516]|eukprot:XP_005765138.1 hypothetical protein EMIHUDRAFT_257088 [Emiliania huxleyi CCMP1516]